MSSFGVGETEDVVELPPAPAARESLASLNSAGTGLPAVRPGGRFGHARARLHDLQSQLDVILGTLPQRPAPGEALAGGPSLGPVAGGGLTDSRRKLPALNVSSHSGGNTLSLSDMTPSPSRQAAAGQMWGADAPGTDPLQTGLTSSLS
jgi:hypothetical protein